MKKKSKNKIKFTKEDIEYILDRKLLDFEYDFIVKAIEAKRNNSTALIMWARGSGKTRLRNETTVLGSIVSDDVIFEEAHYDGSDKGK